MKVYILIKYWRSEDYSNIVAVCSTMEKAEKCKKDHEEDVNWNKSKDFYFEIVTFIVDEEY